MQTSQIIEVTNIQNIRIATESQPEATRMATLDDKLMGEKLHYYCSSSEEEDEPNEPAAASTSHNPVQKSSFRRLKQLPSTNVSG